MYGGSTNWILSENLNDGNYNDNYLIQGGAAAWTASSYDLTTLISGATAYDFYSNTVGSFGGSSYEGAGGNMIGDVNNDGVPDLLFPADRHAGSSIPSTYGSVYVLFGGAGLMTGGDPYASPPGGSTGLRVDLPLRQY